MSGSTFGTLFRVTTWGESHGEALGVTIDGCPAGLPLNESMIQPFMDRRRPGQTKYSTPRQENDSIRILSGVFGGQTTGMPITMAVLNKNAKSGDYSEIAGYYRPGHADFTLDTKYGFRDYRGGGRSSGRETLSRVAAGAVASALLSRLGISVTAYTRSIGPVIIDDGNSSPEHIMLSPLYMPDLNASSRAEDFLLEKMKEQDSVGGIIECVVKGMPIGIGEPVFDKLDAELAKAVMSIGAVKGVEFGDGFQSTLSLGSSNNDAYFLDGQDTVAKQTNHSGGILGGLSDGADIILRAAIKPTPSIARQQDTVGKNGQELKVSIQGRHDPVIVPRAVVVVESMTAITIADGLLRNIPSRLSSLESFYL